MSHFPPTQQGEARYEPWEKTPKKKKREKTTLPSVWQLCSQPVEQRGNVTQRLRLVTIHFRNSTTKHLNVQDIIQNQHIKNWENMIHFNGKDNPESNTEMILKFDVSDKSCKVAIITMLSKVKGNTLLMNEEIGKL